MYVCVPLVMPSVSGPQTPWGRQVFSPCLLCHDILPPCEPKARVIFRERQKATLSERERNSRINNKERERKADALGWSGRHKINYHPSKYGVALQATYTLAKPQPRKHRLSYTGNQILIISKTMIHLVYLPIALRGHQSEMATDKVNKEIWSVHFPPSQMTPWPRSKSPLHLLVALCGALVACQHAPSLCSRTGMGTKSSIAELGKFQKSKLDYKIKVCSFYIIHIIVLVVTRITLFLSSFAHFSKKKKKQTDSDFF